MEDALLELRMTKDILIWLLGVNILVVCEITYSNYVLANVILQQKVYLFVEKKI
ncbi:MAG: hypothetical protein K0R92_3259 [Lachnospiraceae bacterium]|jgi:hypothetical protein|nr:hypothetical protein [Lachnospiraceae bacterium]